MTAGDEVSSRHLPRRGLSDGLMTAVVAAIGEELACELVGLLVHAVHTQTNLDGPHALFLLTHFCGSHGMVYSGFDSSFSELLDPTLKVK
jgi:hypothetical protein